MSTVTAINSCATTACAYNRGGCTAFPGMLHLRQPRRPRRAAGGRGARGRLPASGVRPQQRPHVHRRRHHHRRGHGLLPVLRGPLRIRRRPRPRGAGFDAATGHAAGPPRTRRSMGRGSPRRRGRNEAERAEGLRDEPARYRVRPAAGALTEGFRRPGPPGRGTAGGARPREHGSYPRAGGSEECRWSRAPTAEG